jgi:hypothetical protein
MLHGRDTDTKVVLRRSKLRAVLRHAGWALWDELTLAWFFVFLLETIFWPPWIEINTHGVRIRECWSQRFYPWQRIERFEVGNPSSPRVAYLLLKPSSDPRDLRRGPLVELPYLCRPNARDLVERLTEAQRQFRRPTVLV